MKDSSSSGPRKGRSRNYNNKNRNNNRRHIKQKVPRRAKKKSLIKHVDEGCGPPGRTRTCNLRLRRPLHYPVVLRAAGAKYPILCRSGQVEPPAQAGEGSAALPMTPASIVLTLWSSSVSGSMERSNKSIS